MGRMPGCEMQEYVRENNREYVEEKGVARLELNRRQLAAGRWKLEAGSWQLAAGSW